MADQYRAELEAASASEKRKAEARVKNGGKQSAGSGKRVKGLRETDPWK